MIKLRTHQDTHSRRYDFDVWVNPNKIVSIGIDTSYHGGGTWVNLSGESRFFVHQTPEQILELIHDNA